MEVPLSCSKAKVFKNETLENRTLNPSQPEIFRNLKLSKAEGIRALKFSNRSMRY
jgi:hypothetical protein